MTDSRKHRPDGTTPEPETGGLNEVLREMRDSYAALSRSVNMGNFAQYRLLAEAYGAANLRATRDAASGTSALGESELLRAHLRSIMGEFGVVTNENDAALTNRAYNAHRLVTQFSCWAPELETGNVSIRHTYGLLRYAHQVPDDRRNEYGTKVLKYARTHTPRQTDTYAKKLAAGIAADKFEAACAIERAERRVTIEDLDYGMSEIRAYVPTLQAHWIMDLLTRQAKLLREEHLLDTAEHQQRVRDAAARGEELSPAEAAFIEDPRTVQQLRADMFLETFLSATPQSILESKTEGAWRVTAHVSVIVPVLSLLDPGAPRDVATLNGMQPISTEEARWFAAGVKKVDRILTDPITGHVLTVDTRDAPAPLRKFLKARDQTCRFPGCHRPADNCELDHIQSWSSGGKTCEGNLVNVCKTHHVQKHQKPWRSTHIGNGEVQWEDPLGRITTTMPDPIGPVFEPYDPPPF